jgi:protease secretion system membrane fusion protein
LNAHNDKPSPSGSTVPANLSSAVPARVGRWTMALLLGALLVWALAAPLDEGIPAQGLVSLDTKRKPVQHLQGGIVKEVLVGEGAAVQEGQVLMVLEQATAKANFESIRQHYVAMRSTESRLLSEQAGAGSVQFHADIVKSMADPLVRQHVDTQQHLFKSRRMALQANVAALNANLAGLEAQKRGLVLVIEQRVQQQQLFNDELGGIRDLVKEGYAPRSRQMELERNLAEVGSILADAQANLKRVGHSVEEVGQRLQAVQQEYKKEVDTQLADVRREVQADAEKLFAVTKDLERTELRSPATGQVVGLVVQTLGAVVAPGQKLMDIVPNHAPMLVEARVAPQVIDRLKTGQAADIRFSAFSHAPQLTVGGRVVSVSKDLLSDPDTKQSYYLARVDITPEGLKVLGQREIQPGMLAEVLIKTGERSFFTYLTYPIVRRLAQSMKEE